MHVDVFTVAAQLINFALLLWLLKKLLYAPVLATMERRRARIAAEQQQAQAAKASAEQLAGEYRERLAALDGLEAERRATLQRELDSERSRQLDAIRREAEAARAQAQARLAQEQAHQAGELRRALEQRLLTACRHALNELAACGLETAMARALLARLHGTTLDATTRTALHDGCRIISREPLPAETMEVLREGLNAWAGQALDIHFECEATLAPGIVLALADRRLAWTSDEWLDGLAERLAQADDNAAATLANAGSQAEARHG